MRCHCSLRVLDPQLVYKLVVRVIGINLGAGKLPGRHALFVQDIEFLESAFRCLWEPEKDPYETRDT